MLHNDLYEQDAEYRLAIWLINPSIKSDLLAERSLRHAMQTSQAAINAK